MNDIFHKKMNKIKSASILTKSPEEKVEMYIEKSEKKQKRKKKELEDKLDKQ